MNISKLSLFLVAIFSSVIISCVRNSCDGEDDMDCLEVLPHFTILDLETTNSTMSPNEENENTTTGRLFDG